MKILAFLVVGLSLFNQAQASDLIEIQGAPAKALYLALKGVGDQDIAGYSLKKEATVECLHYYRGVRYNEHYDCKLIDLDSAASNNPILLSDVTKEGIDVRNDGASELYDALVGIRAVIGGGGNPATESKKASVTCIDQHPIGGPEHDEPSNFSCQLQPLN